MCVLGCAALCGWVAVRAGHTEGTGGDLVARIAALKASQRQPSEELIRELEAACVLGSIRPNKHPQRHAMQEVLSALGPREPPRSTTYYVLLAAGIAAGLAALIELTGLLLDFRRLRKGDEATASAWVVTRCHAAPGRMGLVCAGCAAAGACILVATAGAPASVPQGELHGLLALMLLPVGVWLGGLLGVFEAKGAWATVVALPLCALAAAALIALWGMLAGAWHVRWCATALVGWYGLSHVLSRTLLGRAEWIVAVSGLEGGQSGRAECIVAVSGMEGGQSGEEDPAHQGATESVDGEQGDENGVG